MILVAAICALVIGANAQVGPSGIVSPDGVNTQFSHEFANDIAVVGPSGIVTKSGVNRQLTHGEATLNQAAAPAPIPVANFVAQRGIIGHSGIVRPDGNNIQFTHDQANNIVLVGPSGIVTKDGRNIQLTDDLHFARAKRSAGFVSAAGNIGHSGILRADGSVDLFSHDLAHDIVLIGPSGVVTRSGANLQLTDDLRIANPRAKRSAGFVSAAGNIGHSGILRADGSVDLFSHDLAHDIVLIGPSGVVTRSGANLQLTDDLRIANPRVKRSLPLVGPSGMITADGQPIQFTKPGVTILLEGPSGYVMSDGTLVQKRAKRSTDGHLIGDSGIITRDGRLIQLEAGVTVVAAGPSGIVLSNGKNIQL